MTSKLPQNGASAVNLPDPQGTPAAVLPDGALAVVARCANRDCQRLLCEGDVVVHDKDNDFLFCSKECHFAWLVKHGAAEVVTLTRDMG